MADPDATTGGERTDDLIRPFQIEPFGLRGRLVRLGPAIDRILGQHDYPRSVATMLGEAVALASLLAGALKYDGIFTLQTKGDGPVKLIVADVTSAGAVRGYAQFDQARLDRESPGPHAPVPRLLGSGYLAFTVDQGEHTERYQGIVELDGATLSDCVHHYFRQSEQIEAGVRVAVAQGPAGWRAGGVMLQRLPVEGGIGGVESRLSFDGEIASEVQDDAWRRALLLLGTAAESELTSAALLADDLLLRLFHEDGVRVFPAHPLQAQCRCSRDRIETVLRSLPADDLRHLDVDGLITVTCEFCSREYSFTEGDVGGLHADAEAG